jgi:putative FmdB family regulatory protein
MPIYEYTCEECETQFEKFVRSMTSKNQAECPHCGGTHLKRGWSVFGTGKSNGNPSALPASAASACSPSGT